MTRDCGTCNLCCTVMGVEELKKPNYVPCSFMGECGGCKIYGQHPPTCKTWTCAWLWDEFDLFPEHMRPDKIGIVPSMEIVGGETGLPHVWLVIKRDEARPKDDWRKNDELVRLIRKLSMKMYVLVGSRTTESLFQNGEEKVFTPEERKVLSFGGTIQVGDLTVMNAPEPEWLRNV